MHITTNSPGPIQSYHWCKWPKVGTGSAVPAMSGVVVVQLWKHGYKQILIIYIYQIIYVGRYWFWLCKMSEIRKPTITWTESERITKNGCSGLFIIQNFNFQSRPCLQLKEFSDNGIWFLVLVKKDLGLHLKIHTTCNLLCSLM